MSKYTEYREIAKEIEFPFAVPASPKHYLVDADGNMSLYTE